MKVRHIRVRSFRNFVDFNLSFIDATLGRVRPITLLVGANGSGKTTLFSIIEGLLSFAVEVHEDTPITKEIRASGYAAIEVAFPAMAPFDSPIWIALGRKDRAPAGAPKLANAIIHLDQRGGPGKPIHRQGPAPSLNKWIREMMNEEEPLHGGLLHFPHNRWMVNAQRGSIEPPQTVPSWLWRFEAADAWQGSLAQLWVWQNYLDLERAQKGRPNLTPYVAIIEQILGPERTVSIQEGRVRVSLGPGRPTVEPHQLPSGEQQVLTIFGELARRLRPGAVLLIDELEISLHPALQRLVLHHLRALATKHDLQVIITTHSMELVRAAAPDEVVNLDNMALEEQGRG